MTYTNIISGFCQLKKREGDQFLRIILPYPNAGLALGSDEVNGKR